MQTQTKKRYQRGFTLIELMVAMAITAIIVAVLVSITGIALDAWQRGRSEVRAARQAKAMLDTMGKDFESFVSRRGHDFEWLYAAVETTMPGPESNQSPNAAKLIFYTAATDRYLGKIGEQDDKGGDVSCVGYELAFQDPLEGQSGGQSADRSTFILYRKLVDPDQAFEKLLGQPSLETAFSQYATQVKDVENFVCENVYQFTLTFEVEVTQKTETGSTVVPVRVTLGDNATATKFQVKGTGLLTDAMTDGMKPTVTKEELQAGRLTGVQIGLTILSDVGLKKLDVPNLREDVREKILAQESFHYSRNVELPGM